MVNWKNDFNPSELCKRIEETRKLGDDGSVTFQGWDFKLYDTLLYSMVNFSEEIPEIEGRIIAHKAVFEAGRKGEITPNRLLIEIKKGEQNYLNQPITRFALATSISLDIFSKIPKTHVGRTQLIFEMRYPKKFRSEQGKLNREAENILFAPSPDNYLCVRAHVSARSQTHAADKALDALDLVRGIWNLYENRRHTTRWSVGGKPKPVNKIILGPSHFLHFPDGKLASSSRWWYEPSYLGAVQPHRFRDLEKLNTYSLDVMEHLAKSKYCVDLENAIIRYSRALDHRDWDIAFLRLWGVLELLTDTIKNSQELTIKRAAYCYQEYDFNLQILKQLRLYRNRSVHADASNSEIESFLYQLKNVVEDLLYFHLGNSFGFKSIKEAGDFLSLPRDKDALKYRTNMADNALKFFGYKK